MVAVGRQQLGPSQAAADAPHLIGKDDKVASLGSCFAANLVPYLKAAGFHYIEAEKRPAGLPAEAENFSYDKFSAAYGNIYTSRHFRQLLDRALGHFAPQEDRWATADGIVDPFRPGLKYRAKNDAEFDALVAHHLLKVRQVFQTAEVVVFTLGLTEAWCSASDGAVFPACPGTVAGTFDAGRHSFVNFTAAEIVDDLHRIMDALQSLKPEIRLILSVSPVPLVATATDNHVLVASTYSKSVLRVACGEFTAARAGTSYFPSYEIVTGPQAPHDVFEADRRNVSAKGVAEVMRVFLSHCETGHAGLPHGAGTDESLKSELSGIVSAVECEEAAADK